MKALIVLLALLAGVWLWRNGRQRSLAARKRSAERPDAQQEGVEEMVRCPVCGVHLPRTDAVVGRYGIYCNLAHCQEAEA